METPPFNSNPYAPPESPCTQREAEWYLASGCRYLKGIGWLGIVYLMFAIPMSAYNLLTRDSPPMGEVIGSSALMVAMLLYFAVMIRTATRLPHDFERLYRRARWLGILIGAFCFPILTIPAFIAVGRLSKYRTMIEQRETSEHA